MMLSKSSIQSSFTTELPGEHKLDPTRRQTPNACWASVQPKEFSNPSLVAYASELFDELGGDSILGEGSDFLALITGQKTLGDIEPYAMNYGGHQFGHWAGQLGDGRAINIGEIKKDNQLYTLQLKGAGETPYSRSGDGFAVLRSSVREFLCSEAMHYLGVPTTRALSLSLSGDKVMRDMFYDGNPENELGAIVCRVAPSFIRLGNFQIHAARHEEKILQRLVDYTLQQHFPTIELNKQGYLQWLEIVRDSTIEMIVHWMRIGFVHGVMNTDNLSIHGITIDYGPYGWLDIYEPDWTPNTTDAGQKRYRYENQPRIAHWNFVQFAQSIYPLIGEIEPLQEIVDEFPALYEQAHQQMMLDKLGLSANHTEKDEAFIQSWLALLVDQKADWTLIHRALGDWDGALDSIEQYFSDCFYQQPDWDKLTVWLTDYQHRVEQCSGFTDLRKQGMHQVNPWFILRNYIAQEAIEKAEQGDFSGIESIQSVMKTPYIEQQDFKHFAQKRPDWANHKAGCSMLSCSS